MNCLPAEAAIRLEFRRRLGRWPNLREPRTFNEKIQYRKLHGEHHRYVQLADKVFVKEHVREILGADWVVPTIWFGKELPAPDERTWPVPFVIKASHTSGHNVFVRSEEQKRGREIERICQNWLLFPYHQYLIERWYDFVDRQLIVEPIIGENLMDYKFYVFDGVVRFIHVDTDRFGTHKRCFYDRHWNRLSFTLEFPLETRPIERPRHLIQMVKAAETLAADFDFVRIDFYDLDDHPKFGEMTFAPGSGYERFSPTDYDLVMGEYWHQE
jgi:hypothetical protein